MLLGAIAVAQVTARDDELRLDAADQLPYRRLDLGPAVVVGADV